MCHMAPLDGVLFREYGYQQDPTQGLRRGETEIYLQVTYLATHSRFQWISEVHLCEIKF